MRNKSARFSVVLLAAAGLAMGQLFPPDEGCRTITSANLSRPAYLAWTPDPAFGTEIMRITDSAEFGEADVRHHYSKDQPWNCDQSLILLDGGRILDGGTYEYLRTLDMPNEVRWSNRDPGKFFGTSGNKFVSVNAATGATTTLHTFTGYTRIYLGPWEGNISVDDSTVVLVTSENSDAHIIVYDITGDRVVADKSQGSLGYAGSGIDWACISQSGQFVVINGRGSSDDAIRSYDRNLNLVANLFDVGEHGDMGYDALGHEVLVQAGYPAQMARLDNGAKTTIADCRDLLWGHISCRNHKRPGWCYVSSNQTGEVLAIKLDGSLTYERFTLHRSSEASYNAEAQGVPSSDGTMVMYASDWNGTAEINSYVVRVPSQARAAFLGVSGGAAVSLRLLPNPGNRLLLLSAARPLECVAIFDARGRQVHFSRPGTREQRVDVSGFPAGLYLVRISATGETWLAKFVRQ